MKVKEVNHSHPIRAIGEEIPSGYGHNPTANNMYSEPNPYREKGDYHTLRMLIHGGLEGNTPVKGLGEKAQNIIFRVYNSVNKTYIQYDEQKAIKQL